MSDTAIPAITLHQPWASLIASGAKRFETRSWAAPASVIGRRIAIHAGKNRDEGETLIGELFDDFKDGEGWTSLHPAALRLLRAAGIHSWNYLPYGAVVCTARLVACHPAASVAGQEDAVFGDFSAGRWAWDLDEVRPYQEPVPCRGYQGIWTFDPATGVGSWGWKA